MCGLAKSYLLIVPLMLALVVVSSPVFSQDTKEFSSEKMISELEKQMDLTREQWEKLKPVLDQKSKELFPGTQRFGGQRFCRTGQDDQEIRFDVTRCRAESKRSAE